MYRVKEAVGTEIDSIKIQKANTLFGRLYSHYLFIMSFV
jgi:hypothetical protein